MHKIPPNNLPDPKNRLDRFKLRFIAIFIIAALFSPNRAYSNPPPLIGAQISVLEAADTKGCAIYFNQLRKLGYNTIILRVFHNRGDRFHGPVAEAARQRQPEGVYFANQQVPVVSNLLTPVCALAHEAGLQVMAWMTTLKADYSHTLKSTVLSYNETNGKVEAEARLLDPEANENIDFIIHLFTDLAAQPIDGILLQDDLMLRYKQGFQMEDDRVVPAPDKLYVFKRKNQKEIETLRPYFKKWRQHQALILQTLARRIFTACRRIKPNLICAQNVHYEVFLNENWGRDWFAMTKTALESSTADYLMVMTYQKRMIRELELKPGELNTVMEKIFTRGRNWQKTKLIFKFTTPQAQLPAAGRAASLATLHRVINQARRHNYFDLVLTPCNNLTAAAAIK